MSDDPRDFPTVRTRGGGWRYAYSWEIDAMEEERVVVTCQSCGSDDTYWDRADGWCCNGCKRTDADE